MAKEVTEDETTMAIGIAIGCAARLMVTGVDYSETVEVQAVWPEVWSADALQLGILIAIAVNAALGGEASTLQQVAGGIMPNV